MKLFQKSILPLLSLAWACTAQRANDLTSARILTPEEQQAALDFVLNKTLASGFATYGWNHSIEDELPVIEMRTLATTNVTHYEFQFSMNRMLQQLFGDAHIRVEVEESTNYRSIDLCLSWVPSETEEGSWDLISTCDTEYADIGDLVVSMGGVSATELFDKLKEVIPHENEYFLTGLPASWLVREDFLLYFGMLGDDGTVGVILERDGAVLEATTPLMQPKPEASANDTSFVSYEILNESSTAIFTLNECTYDETYVSAMNEFWSAVIGNPNLDKVVLDLRDNRGGDFIVAPAFLSFITQQAYPLFDVLQRKSEDFCGHFPTFCDSETLAAVENLGGGVTDNYITAPATVLAAFFSPATTQPEELFAGDFYVLTSGVTFSSAQLFAGVVQNSGLGTLVGTPTGNTPTFWGHVLQFPVPNTDLKFFLTTSQNIWPVTGGRDAIVPDVSVPTTRNDILEGRDAQLEFIVSDESIPVSEYATDSPTELSTDITDDEAGEEDTLPVLEDSSSRRIVAGFSLAITLSCGLFC